MSGGIRIKPDVIRSLLATVVVAGMLTVPPAALADEPVSSHGRYGVAYDGPELIAAVGYHQANRDIGDEWLILSVQLMSPSSTSVKRGDISLRAPDGKRLRLLTQAEYREILGTIRSRVRRAMTNSKPLRYLDDFIRPCDRWFLTDPWQGFAHDEIFLNTFNLCFGPMVFRVPGNIQPGRWRLVIELEESTADIPFVLEVDD